MSRTTNGIYDAQKLERTMAARMTFGDRSKARCCQRCGKFAVMEQRLQRILHLSAIRGAQIGSCGKQLFGVIPRRGCDGNAACQGLEHPNGRNAR